MATKGQKRVGVRGPEVKVESVSVTHLPPNKDPWYKSILTDHNGDFDMGAVLVGVVTVFMCLNAGYDTMALHTKFNAQEFGIGIAAVLGGFAAYKYGDAKRPPPDVTSVTTVQN